MLHSPEYIAARDRNYGMLARVIHLSMRPSTHLIFFHTTVIFTVSFVAINLLINTLFPAFLADRRFSAFSQLKGLLYAFFVTMVLMFTITGFLSGALLIMESEHFTPASLAE